MPKKQRRAELPQHIRHFCLGIWCQAWHVVILGVVVQVSSPTREPSFAAQKFMLDVFLAMPGIRAAGDGLPVLFRNAAAVARPWEVRRDGASSLQPGSGTLPLS